MICQVVVTDVKGGLAGGLQRALDLRLKRGKGIEKVNIFVGIERHARLARPRQVAKPPLACLARDLERHIAVDRAPCQNYLGRLSIGQDMRDRARIMIIEQPEPRQTLSVGAHRANRSDRVCLARGHRKIEHRFNLRLSEEMRIKQLTIALNAGKCGEVFFKQVRAGSHTGQNDKIIKIAFGHISSISARLAGL